jgi:hypothetical protein
MAMIQRWTFHKQDSADLALNAKEILDGIAADPVPYPQKKDIEV